MKKTLPLIAIALLASASARAEYVGPQGDIKTYTTVAEVLEYPVEDKDVVLTGYLTRKVSMDKYRFQDDTGHVRVEIDAGQFPAGVKIDDKTKVRLTGEIEAEFLTTPEVDASKLEIVTAP